MIKCAQCGVCCRLFLINLTEEEYGTGEYKTWFDEFMDDFKEAESAGANILRQKEDGSCIYLENNKCSIHSRRPEACRNFFCSSKNPGFKSMIEQIKQYKRI
jgi:Fe-S-cluster containining protein